MVGPAPWRGDGLPDDAGRRDVLAEWGQSLLQTAGLRDFIGDVVGKGGNLLGGVKLVQIDLFWHFQRPQTCNSFPSNTVTQAHTWAPLRTAFLPTGLNRHGCSRCCSLLHWSKAGSDQPTSTPRTTGWGSRRECPLLPGLSQTNRECSFSCTTDVSRILDDIMLWRHCYVSTLSMSESDKNKTCFQIT